MPLAALDETSDRICLPDGRDSHGGGHPDDFSADLNLGLPHNIKKYVSDLILITLAKSREDPCELS